MCVCVCGGGGGTIVQVQCCFTSAETMINRDGEPRTATSTFTQLLSSGHGQAERCVCVGGRGVDPTRSLTIRVLLFTVSSSSEESVTMHNP